MRPKKYTKEDFENVKELKSHGLSLKQIAAEMGFSYGEVRYLNKINNDKKRDERKRRAKVEKPKASTTTKRHTKPDVVNTTSSPNTSSTLVIIRDGEKMTNEDLLKAHGLDPHKFKIESILSNVWGKPDEKHTQIQSKIKVSPSDYDVDEIVDAVNQELKPIPHFDKKELSKQRKKRLLIVPLYDLHFGIATAYTMRPYLIRIQQVLSKGWGAVVIVLGGDYFHSNSMSKSVTVKGTQLDPVDMSQALNDGTYFFNQLMESALSNSRSVSVVTVSGNHDADISYVWADAMKHKYSANVNVFINKPDQTWNAMNWRGVGIMMAHGDVAKAKLPMLFATEAKPIWGKTNYHAIFTGHFHKEVISDDDGVTLFQVGTPKPHDRWEVRNGFVMSRRKMELFEFSERALECIDYLEPEYDD